MHRFQTGLPMARSLEYGSVPSALAVLTIRGGTQQFPHRSQGQRADIARPSGLPIRDSLPACKRWHGLCCRCSDHFRTRHVTVAQVMDERKQEATPQSEANPITGLMNSDRLYQQ